MNGQIWTKTDSLSTARKGLGMRKVRNMVIYLIMYLNYIPRYGRIYTLVRNSTGRFSTKDFDKRWEWQRHGMWGLNFLDRCFPRQLSRYIDDYSTTN